MSMTQAEADAIVTALESLESKLGDFGMQWFTIDNSRLSYEIELKDFSGPDPPTFEKSHCSTVAQQHSYLGYTLKLKHFKPASGRPAELTIFLQPPSEDPVLNRRAVRHGLKRLIESPKTRAMIQFAADDPAIPQID